MSKKSRWIVGISGASGAAYGIRLLQVMSEKGYGVDLILSPAGRTVIRQELGIGVPDEKDDAKAVLADKFDIDVSSLAIYSNSDFETPPASGSYRCAGMIIVPCSMGTLAALAQGFANNLMRRAGDVMLKEKRSLVLVPRETPLSAIHLENMLKLARVGAVILPPMPGFYQGPQSIDQMVDFIVGRILDVIGIEHRLYQRWKENLGE
jgi:4-hydroxy-3-polyprenylbenzoate decarboxylase